MATPGPSRASRLFAASGTTLEWYDFTLYAYLAPVISELFFPKSVTGSELGSLLATFGVFAAGFLVRPLGAVFFGRYGDTRGRRAAYFRPTTRSAGPRRSCCWRCG